jgi:hypothetical protein
MLGVELANVTGGGRIGIVAFQLIRWRLDEACYGRFHLNFDFMALTLLRRETAALG